MRRDRTKHMHSRCRRLAAMLILPLALAGCAGASSVERAEVYVDEDAAPEETAKEDEILTVHPDDLFEPELPEVTPSEAAQLASASLIDAVPAAEETAESDAQTASDESAEEETPAAQEEDDGIDYTEILFLGDSQFANGRDAGTDIASLVPDYLPGMDCKVYNLGIGGTSAALDRDERWMSYDNWYSPCFLGMVHLLAGDVSSKFLEDGYPEIYKIYRQIDPKKLDYIVIDYGVNDFFNVAPIYDDEDPHNLSHFSPAYQNGLTILGQTCPQAKIIVCTPCYAEFFARDGAFLGSGNVLSNGIGVLADYVATTEYCAGLNENCIFMDMYHGTRIDLDSYTVNDYLTDGIHLSARGRRAYAAAVAQAIYIRRTGVQTELFELIKLEDY